jgi:diaminopimelate epimerase
LTVFLEKKVLRSIFATPPFFSKKTVKLSGQTPKSRTKSMQMTFTKYSGSGNDFVIIDNRTGVHNGLQKPDVIRRLCHRHDGIGADGIIFLESSEAHPYRMRIFQPDGLEVEMCGNGLRCLGHFIHTLHPEKSHFEIATMHSMAHIGVHGDEVTIQMPEPVNMNLHQNLSIDGKQHIIHSINTGVPHAIVFVDDLEQNGLMDLGKKVRHDPVFAPEGTNVNFVKVTSPTMVEVRTFERGVEGETLACGTGAAAAAIITGACYGYEGPISVRTRSKEHLMVSFPSSQKNSTPVTLRGTVRVIFSGTLV